MIFDGAVGQQEPEKDGCHQKKSEQCDSQGLLDLIEKRGDFACAGFERLLQAAQFISQMEAGHDGEASAV